MPASDKSLEQLQRQIGYQFSDTSLLRLALRHKSIGKPNNERLEFLGDAILGAVVAELLFRDEAKDAEGNMTVARASLVNGRTLARLGRKIGLGAAMELGRGEKRSGGVRSSIIEDALEALIGAVFMDSNFDTTREVVRELLGEELTAQLSGAPEKDPKTELQELAQARKVALPVYEVLSAEGPPHQRQFTVSCSLSLADEITQGSGNSLRNAERGAARAMLQLLGEQARGAT